MSALALSSKKCLDSQQPHTEQRGISDHSTSVTAEDCNTVKVRSSDNSKNIPLQSLFSLTWHSLVSLRAVPVFSTSSYLLLSVNFVPGTTYT